MRDCIEIGASPPEEDCVSVGADNYHALARAECRRYIEVIRQKLGVEPGSAHLAIKSNPHDFGNYLEVVCYFDDNDEEGMDYAFRCESSGPKTWDDVKPLPVIAKVENFIKQFKEARVCQVNSSLRSLADVEKQSQIEEFIDQKGERYIWQVETELREMFA